MMSQRRFERFSHRVEELRQTRFIRSKYSPRFSIQWTQAEGMRYELAEPDEEDLRSLLLTFRQFVPPNEPVFLSCLYNLLYAALSSDQLRGFLLLSRDGWRGVLKTNGI